MRNQNLYNIDQLWARSIIAAIAVVTLSLSVAAQQPTPARSFPPPGKRVDVGGWRLHLRCTGRKKPHSPTVVLESGDCLQAE